jgi:hypothetical protein
MDRSVHGFTAIPKVQVVCLQHLVLILRKEFRGGYGEKCHFDGFGIALAVYSGRRQLVFVFARTCGIPRVRSCSSYMAQVTQKTKKRRALLRDVRYRRCQGEQKGQEKREAQAIRFFEQVGISKFWVWRRFSEVCLSTDKERQEGIQEG